MNRTLVVSLLFLFAENCFSSPRISIPSQDVEVYFSREVYHAIKEQSRLIQDKSIQYPDIEITLDTSLVSPSLSGDSITLKELGEIAKSRFITELETNNIAIKQGVRAIFESDVSPHRIDLLLIKQSFLPSKAEVDKALAMWPYALDEFSSENIAYKAVNTAFSQQFGSMLDLAKVETYMYVKVGNETRSLRKFINPLFFINDRFGVWYGNGKVDIEKPEANALFKQGLQLPEQVLNQWRADNFDARESVYSALDNTDYSKIRERYLRANPRWVDVKAMYRNSRHISEDERQLFLPLKERDNKAINQVAFIMNIDELSNLNTKMLDKYYLTASNSNNIFVFSTTGEKVAEFRRFSTGAINNPYDVFVDVTDKDAGFIPVLLSEKKEDYFFSRAETALLHNFITGNMSLDPHSIYRWDVWKEGRMLALLHEFASHAKRCLSENAITRLDYQVRRVNSFGQDLGPSGRSGEIALDSAFFTRSLQYHKDKIEAPLAGVITAKEVQRYLRDVISRYSCDSEVFQNLRSSLLAYNLDNPEETSQASPDRLRTTGYYMARARELYPDKQNLFTDTTLPDSSTQLIPSGSSSQPSSKDKKLLTQQEFDKRQNSKKNPLKLNKFNSELSIRAVRRRGITEGGVLTVRFQINGKGVPVGFKNIAEIDNSNPPLFSFVKRAIVERDFSAELSTLTWDEDSYFIVDVEVVLQ